MNRFLKMFFIFIFCLPVSFAGQRITYEDFIHFNYDQKLSTIKIVHDFLIRHEQLEIAEQAKHKKTSQYKTFKKIYNFFISSAYAAEDDAQFDVEDLESSQLCFYAGWISTRIRSRGRSICSHPRNIKRLLVNSPGLVSDKNKAFLKNVSLKYEESIAQKPAKLVFDKKTEKFEFKDESCGNKDIVCNPKIYGLKSKSPICVSGNINLGLNSSLLCSQALDVIKAGDEDEYKDTIAGILKNASGDNKGEFFHILKASYDTCICGKDATKETINQGHFKQTIDPHYAEVLFNQRGCYGIISQTEQIFKAVKNDPTSCQSFADTSFNGAEGADSWLDYLNKAYNVIEKQNLRDEIINIVSERKANFSRVIPEAERANTADKEREDFEAKRAEHFELYSKNGLCGEQESPKIIAETTEDIPEKTEEKTEEEEEDTPIADVPEPDVPEVPTEKRYTLTLEKVGAEPSELNPKVFVTAKLLLNDQPVEDEGLIKKIFLAKTEQESEESVGEDSPAGGNGPGERSFLINQEDSKFEIEAIFTDGDDQAISSSVEVPGLITDVAEQTEVATKPKETPKDESEIKSCSVSIKHLKPNDPASQLVAAITVENSAGEKISYPNDDARTPPGMRVVWYTSQPTSPNARVPAKIKTPGLVDETEKSDEGNKEEKIDPNLTGLSIYADSVKDEDVDQHTEFEIITPLVDSKFGVRISAGESCSQSATIVVKAKKVFGPIFQGQAPGRGHIDRGQILGGQR